MDVEIEPPHVVAQGRVVAHLVERIVALDGLDRRRNQQVVDFPFVGAVGVDDVAVTRHADARRPHVDEDAARPGAAVVDDHEFPAVAVAAQAADQMPVAVGDVDDADAVRPQDHGERLAVAMIDAYVARADGEALVFVVPDDGAVVLAHDGAVALVD